MAWIHLYRLVCWLCLVAVFGKALEERPTEDATTNGACPWDEDESGTCVRQGHDENVADEDEEDDDWDADLPLSYEERERIYYKYRDEPEEGEEWDAWKHGSNNDIYEELGCAENDYGHYQTMHTTETWKTLNKIYHEVLRTTAEDHPELAQDPSIPPEFKAHGFSFPIEVRKQPGVGRGVYATTDIPKGSLLYGSTNSASFSNGQTYRNFLRALPKNLACDVAIWASVRWASLATEHDEKHVVCVDLDEGSFVNSAEEEEEDMLNMQLGNDAGVLYYDLKTRAEREPLWFGCKMTFWASRDIAAGEEIRVRYDDYIERDGWMYLGL